MNEYIIYSYREIVLCITCISYVGVYEKKKLKILYRERVKKNIGYLRYSLIFYISFFNSFVIIQWNFKLVIFL